MPNLTVAENVFLGREIKRGGMRDLAAMNAHAAELLAEHKLRCARRTGSTACRIGKQLIEVIANLDRNARFLPLDEPTTALDGNQAAEMLQTVRRIAVERGIGVVLVSHKIDEVLAVCDEITVLAGGKVVLHSDVKGLERGAIISAIAGDADHRDNGLREAGAHRREGRRAFPDKVLTVTDLAVRGCRGSTSRSAGRDPRRLRPRRFGAHAVPSNGLRHGAHDLRDDHAGRARLCAGRPARCDLEASPPHRGT
ncbi:MAG: hypothetical protein R3D59_09360 [Paracoccaceae bacterium]